MPSEAELAALYTPEELEEIAIGVAKIALLGGYVRNLKDTFDVTYELSDHEHYNFWQVVCAANNGKYFLDYAHTPGSNFRNGDVKCKLRLIRETLAYIAEGVPLYDDR